MSMSLKEVPEPIEEEEEEEIIKTEKVKTEKEINLASKSFNILQNKLDIDYIKAMDIIIEIDETVDKSKTDKFLNYWEDTFLFADGSQLILTKKQKGNKFILYSVDKKE